MLHARLCGDANAITYFSAYSDLRLALGHAMVLGLAWDTIAKLLRHTGRGGFNRAACKRESVCVARVMLRLYLRKKRNVAFLGARSSAPPLRGGVGESVSECTVLVGTR